jgi:hypothetical protein
MESYFPFIPFPASLNAPDRLYIDRPFACHRFQVSGAVWEIPAAPVPLSIRLRHSNLE